MATVCAHMQTLSLRPTTGLAGRAIAVPVCPVPHRRRGLTIEARYRGVNTDRSQVAQFRRSAADTGSPEVQVAQLSARVIQLTSHLQANKKDFAAKRGLMMVLSQRRKMLEYLRRVDREQYEVTVSKLGIRGLKEIID
mmetsp:Transcript_16687/g.49901  ORF Transcript_16687/g.49901 Transcript_16687/m.49901 type:complete len:138 (+) Transcript_16687:117-530(+)|eukprot:CAMPEP_0206139434 /NCGR_PEP_ID=MMETSP1473-20131121/6096_1 /ASSEMBLY_ACC=CAM_ASM_001109 /TAXON_ID=1461547 /ORGANISM="Stichococcus sp, Strain RCC1054" /LENGTH=137 /DNA_ID=CAMNT_0053533233 /DNA_START=99 /DNA_END=512 /DNA_ORIENTATION=-